MGGKGPEANGVRILPPDAFGVDGTSGKQYRGSVKSFREERGWGFIAGDEVLEVFGKDIFLSRRELGSQVASVGAQVSFSVAIDSYDGQPQAKEVALGGALADSAEPPAKR